MLKRLREDHHLPLDMIRTVFEIYDFDPAHLEPFILADSLNNRLTHLANGGDALSAAFSAEELARRMGITSDRLRDYAQAKLIRAAPQGGNETYSFYDANIIALCEHAARLGIPLDSLRNISAYVRVAFELEHKILFGAAGQMKGEGKKALGEIVVCQEIVTGLIQNLLQSLIRHRLVDLIEPDSDTGGSLDEVLFRPSPMFCKRHGLDRAIETAQETLCASPEQRGQWARTGRLMIHAGRYREAAFFLEQALLQWPMDDRLLSLHARALVLSGAQDRGVEPLCRLAFSRDPDPLDRAYLALCLLHRIGTESAEQALASRGLSLPGFMQQTLESACGASWEVRSEVQMIAGWVLSMAPDASAGPDAGAALLAETLDGLKRASRGEEPLPGLRERYLINTAYLLYRARTGASYTGDAGVGEGKPAHSPEALRSLICSLDPAGAFAEAVYLEREAPLR